MHTYIRIKTYNIHFAGSSHIYILHILPYALFIFLFIYFMHTYISIFYFFFMHTLPYLFLLAAFAGTATSSGLAYFLRFFLCVYFIYHLNFFLSFYFSILVFDIYFKFVLYIFVLFYFFTSFFVLFLFFYFYGTFEFITILWSSPEATPVAGGRLGS